MGVNKSAFENAVPAGGTLLLDTNVLIAYLEGGQAITDAATLLLDEWVRNNRNPAVISMVTVMELLVGPLRASRGVTDVADFLHGFPNVDLAPIDFDAAYAAAALRADTGLRAPDALIIGSAVANHVDAIVSNDRAWNGKSPISVVTLNDYVA